MKKIALIFTILLSISQNLIAQSDTLINNGVYESLFSYDLHSLLYVRYKLYKGGGDCNRSSFSFHIGNIKNSPTNKDYTASGYDKGHMVNAEDFAYDCAKDEKTFFFYNALPQTPNLNRGIWKHYETEIRKLSQTDSLLILCGGIFSDNKFVIPTTKVVIPTQCWKYVYNLKTKQVVYCLLFTNDAEKNSVKKITKEQLIKLVGNYRKINL